MSEQTTAIVKRLQKGPAYNHQLAKIALKYTSRISDARKAGHDIFCEHTPDGQFRYWLFA